MASHAAELFSLLDKAGDGYISRGQFHKGMTGKHKKQLRRLLGAAGEDWKVLLSRIDTGM